MAAYALFPIIDRNRFRARWATYTFIFNGLFGMAYFTFYLMLHRRWLVVSSHERHVIYTFLRLAGAIFLVVTLILILSGQFFGSKREVKEI